MQRVRLNKPNGHAKPKERYKLNGRPKGVKNKTTRIIKDAIMLAAESVGADGYGKHGLVGYLERIAIKEPKAFCILLGKLLPLQIQTPNNEPPRLIVADMSPQEAAQLYAETLRTLSLNLQDVRQPMMIEGKAKEVGHDQS